MADGAVLPTAGGVNAGVHMAAGFRPEGASVGPDGAGLCDSLDDERASAQTTRSRSAMRENRQWGANATRSQQENHLHSAVFFGELGEGNDRGHPAWAAHPVPRGLPR